jgi:signal transduction histidine kinase
MVQDVFEVSKAAADQLPVSMERLDLGKLLRQTLADLDDPIQKSGLTFKTDLPAEPVMIDADGKRLYRVFQNLIDNALRYALEGSRVYLTLKTAERAAETAGLAQVSVRNTSRDELPEGVDFTARFVRGDESRTDGGSGLGLSIASSFTEACGGTFQVETVADLFTAVVTFPLAETEQEAER